MRGGFRRIVRAAPFFCRHRYEATFASPIELPSRTMFLVSLCFAALMGYAIQRGATCTVAAVDEIVRTRRTRRLAAMMEASIWVAGLLLIAQQVRYGVTLPKGHAISAFAICGGLLLGAGAYINQACVFGAIARLGSGEWAYLATPVGFYLGTLVAANVMPEAPFPQLVSPLAALPNLAAFAAGLFMVCRLLVALVGLLRSRPATARQVRAEIGKRLWRPEDATAVIGIAFFFLLVFEGPWAYTDVLNDAAQGAWHDLGSRAALLVALLLGAVLGGWSAGRLQAVAPNARQVLRCLAGGALMGAGSALIPGSNDGLILLGMPLLFAHAWVAFAAMAFAILALMLGRRWVRLEANTA